MRYSTIERFELGPHKPLVSSSNLLASTISFRRLRKVPGSPRAIATEGATSYTFG